VLDIYQQRLIQLGMSLFNRPIYDAFNQELRREIQYDFKALKETILRNVPFLNEQQKYVYDTLMKVANDRTGGFFFLNAPGGIGKMFLRSLILAMIRSQNEIALGSSGIACDPWIALIPNDMPFDLKRLNLNGSR
jgi:hypothetical protein